MAHATRVLLTGAGGFIGRRVLHRRPPDWSVIALSRQVVQAEPGVMGVRWSGAIDRLPEALDEPFDVTIHLAGSSDHGLAAREPWSDLQATGVTAAALLGRIKTRRIVLLSSAAVYAGRVGLVDPGVPAEPPMAYGLSKLYVEGLAAALVANARVDDVTILRLYNAYGPGERAGRLVPRVVAALRAASPFMLTGDPGSLSDPLHVDDVVGGLIAAARGGQEGRVTRLDLCGGDARPLLEQIGRIAAALDSEPPAVEIQANPDEMPIRFWSSSEPVRRHLGLAPFLSLTDGVRRYAAEAGWALRGG